jgi:hypothetical protein
MELNKYSIGDKMNYLIDVVGCSEEDIIESDHYTLDTAILEGDHLQDFINFNK